MKKAQKNVSRRAAYRAFMKDCFEELTGPAWAAPQLAPACRRERDRRRTISKGVGEMVEARDLRTCPSPKRGKGPCRFFAR